MLGSAGGRNHSRGGGRSHKKGRGQRPAQNLLSAESVVSAFRRASRGTTKAGHYIRALVGEGAEERGALVGVAPLRAEPGAGEAVLIGDADGRVRNRRERVEPLHGAAGRVVRDVL